MITSPHDFYSAAETGEVMAREVLVLVLTATLFSGCLGGGAPAAPTDLASSSSGDNRTFEPPVVDFVPSASPVVAGQTVTFDAADSFDPEGGNLTYAWDLGDGTQATGVAVEHTFEAFGDYRIRLNVTSDASNLTAAAGLTLRVLDPASIRRPLVLADVAGDGVHDWSDLRAGSVFDASGVLTVGFQLHDLSQLASFGGPIVFAFNLGENPYEVYALAGTWALYDVARGQDVASARVIVEAADDVLLVQVPLVDLGVRPPFAVYFETRLGEGKTTHGVVGDDRMPDSGTAAYPS
jgi:plastocyanin